MMFFLPKEDTLKILLISQLKMCLEGGGQEGGTWRMLCGFLTGDMEDIVVADVMNDVLSPQVRGVYSP